MITNIDIFSETMRCLKYLVDTTVSLYKPCSIVNDLKAKTKNDLKSINLNKKNNKLNYLNKVNNQSINLINKYSILYCKKFIFNKIKLKKNSFKKRIQDKFKFKQLDMANISFKLILSKNFIKKSNKILLSFFLDKIDKKNQNYLSLIFRINFLHLYYILFTIHTHLKLFKINYFDSLNYFKLNINPFISLNLIQIDKELIDKTINNTNLNIKSDKVKNIKKDIIKSSQLCYNIKPEPISNQLKNKDYFKIPFTSPIIESTQSFIYVPSTQYFNIEQQEHDDEKQIDLIPCNQTLILNEQNYTFQNESDIFETQIIPTELILEEDKSIKSKIDLNINQVKTYSQDFDNQKIYERKFIDFVPLYNNLNPLLPTRLNDQTQYQSQIAFNCNNSKDLNTQVNLSTSNLSNKSLKRRSFMIIGLSKKQRIKKHLHKMS